MNLEGLAGFRRVSDYPGVLYNITLGQRLLLLSEFVSQYCNIVTADLLGPFNNRFGYSFYRSCGGHDDDRFAIKNPLSGGYCVAMVASSHIRDELDFMARRLAEADGVLSVSDYDSIQRIVDSMERTFDMLQKSPSLPDCLKVTKEYLAADVEHIRVLREHFDSCVDDPDFSLVPQ
ncbi:MAG: hypothetical protein KDI13_08070 [Alphaproteobacteria bacterium]|nr:hypothetical protein [Alphaproteobacteria bacterium]